MLKCILHREKDPIFKYNLYMNENDLFATPPGDQASFETRERLRGTVEKLCDLSPDVLSNYLEARVKRRETIREELKRAGIAFEEQGTHFFVNLINTFKPSEAKEEQRKIVVSAHYDVVTGTPGANDNASSVAVCLELAKFLQSTDPALLNGEVEIVFFDGEEEESGGLKGSREYCDTRGSDLQNKSALAINLEFAGIGDTLVLWPHNDENHQLVEMLKQASGVPTETLRSFGNVASDHEPFREIKVPAVTISMMPQADLETIKSTMATLREGELLSDAVREKTSALKHYHTPSDTPDTLEPEAMETMLLLLKKIVAKGPA
jgi:hypothetical protein